MFDNKYFDDWLDQETQEILKKIGKEKLNTEEMILLSLKAQSNHFYHMDQDIRNDITNTDRNIRNDIANMDQNTKTVIAEIRKDITRLDKKIDHFETWFRWYGGITASLILGIFIKIFFIH